MLQYLELIIHTHIHAVFIRVGSVLHVNELPAWLLPEIVSGAIA